MPVIRPDNPADKRSLTFRHIPHARDRLRDELRGYRDHQFRIARILWQVQTSGHHYSDACTTIAAWAENNFGMSATESQTLARLGATLEARPDVEGLIRGGWLHIENAAAIAPIVSRRELIEAGEDWVEIARTTPQKKLRRKVDLRLEEAARAKEREQQGCEAGPRDPGNSVDPGDVVVGVEVHLPRRDLEQLDRAQVLASRKAGRWLTRGQTLSAVLDHYVTTFDPRLTKPGTRRVGDTGLADETRTPGKTTRTPGKTTRTPGKTTRTPGKTMAPPGSRYVPEAVKRAVRERSGGQCEFPGCTHKIFRCRAHVDDHAAGGSRETDNLFDFCWVHHLLFDAGVITLVSGSPDHDPVFAVNGRSLRSDGRYETNGHDPPECVA